MMRFLSLLNMKLAILKIEKVYYQQWSTNILLVRLPWACACHELAFVLGCVLKAPVVSG